MYIHTYACNKRIHAAEEATALPLKSVVRFAAVSGTCVNDNLPLLAP